MQYVNFGRKNIRKKGKKKYYEKKREITENRRINYFTISTFL